jgi:PAS domain S-box-containing protein
MLDDLTNNESLFAHAFELSALGMAIVDQHGRLRRVNDAFCKMLGYTKEELSNMRFLEITHPADLEIDLGYFAQVLQGKIDKYTIDKRYVHKLGRTVWGRLTVSVVRSTGDRPIYFWAQVEDLSAVSESKREAQRSESVLESVFQASEGAISLIDRELKFVIFNQQFIVDHTSLTGQEPVRGQFVYGAFAPDVAKDRREVLERVLKGDKVVLDTKYFVAGTPVYYRTSFSPVKVGGQVTGITSYSLNLTDQRIAEAQLLKLNRFYQFISQINQVIVRAEDEETILRETCKIAVEHGKFRMAWAGPYDADTGSITPVTWAGYEAGYLKATGFSALESPQGSGPTGRAVRSGSAVYTNDIATDPSMVPWRDAALARGYHSSMTLPLFAESKIVAVVALYMDQPSFFTGSEITMLKELTDNISFALDKIRLRISENRRKELSEKTAAELRESEEKFRTLVEQSQVGVYILQGPRLVYANPLLERITGYTADELIGMENFGDLIYMEDRQAALEKYNSRIAGQMIVNDYVARLVRKDGSIAHVQTIASGITYRNDLAAIGTVIDITDRLQEDRRINKAVISAQERERVQMGMELHDNVQQIIAGSLLHVDYAVSTFDDRLESIHSLGEVKRFLSECMIELRRLSHQLAPSMRFEKNLNEKVKALIETMNVGQTAKVDLYIQKFRKPPNEEMQIAFYRILQEQLTNIIKYSGASRVTISLVQSHNHLILSIKDNGRGFDPTTKKTGIGLENIRRRVSALEGEMKIISSVGNGCELLLEVPVSVS